MNSNIKISKIFPQGFCSGVVDAWSEAKKIALNNKNKKKIYMIGWLVHNKNIIKELNELGIETIDDDNNSRYKIVENLKDPKNSIIIFSAHGSDPKAIKLAKNKNFEVYDLTCKYVNITHELVKEKINLGYQIIFIGKINHPETKGIMAINSKIHLITCVDDCKNLNIKDEKIFLTNQTTISIIDFYDIIKELKNKFKNIDYKNDICNATLERQEAIKNMDDEIDILIVVGDKKSNNSNKLVEIGKTKNIDSYLIEGAEDINLNWFKNKKHIGISSGSSTPTKITNTVMNFLKESLDNE